MTSMRSLAPLPRAGPTSSSTRPRCRCSGSAGPTCRPGLDRCGACSRRRCPGRVPRTWTPNSTRSGRVADPAMTKLRDLMNTSVVTAAPDTTVTAAAAGMVRARVGSVIVLQGSFLAGILTERDVLRAAASGEDLSVSLVSAWMSPDPQAASLDMTAEEAAQIMLLNGFRHLPVLDGRTVCGVVSIRDLFAAKIRRPVG